MTWDTEYQQASFKGVPFSVDNVGLKLGRNVQTNEYPDTEDVSSEDISRKARSITLNGYLLGADYFNSRDALITALESKGPGELIHPYQGVFTMICTSADIQESKDEGGIVRFTANFVEVGETKFPSIANDRNLQLTTASNNLLASSKNHFVSNVKMVNVPDYVRNGAVTKVSSMVSNVRSVVNSGGLFNSGGAITTTSFINKFANLSLGFEDIINPIASVKQIPDSYADLALNVFGLIQDIGANTSSVKKALAPARVTTVNKITEYTAQNVDNNNNNQVATDFINLAGAATEAGSFVKQDFASHSEAIAARDNLIEHLDALSEIHQDKAEIFKDIREVKTQLIKSVPGDDERLPRIQYVVLPKTRSSITLAYDLYEDIDKAQDLVDRNKVKHPGFVPGDKELEILVNE